MQCGNQEALVQDKRTPSWFVWISMLFTLLISESTVMFGANASKLFEWIWKGSTAATSISLAYIVFKQKKITLSAKIGLLIGLCICIIATMMINADWTLGYIFKLCLLLFAFCIMELVTLEDFVINYEKTVFFLAVFSLVVFVAFAVAPKIVEFAPILTNKAGVNFYNLFFCVVLDNGRFNTRNFGIFREPGVYQMYLIVAMLFQVSMSQKTKLHRILVYTAAILTTGSTTGYLALVLVWLVILLRKDSISRKSKIIVVFGGLLAIVALFLVAPDFVVNIMRTFLDKFDKSTNYWQSGVARLASITANLRVAFEYPLFGAGQTKLQELFPIVAEKIHGTATEHNTNLLLIQFSTHGILYGLIWLYSFIRTSVKFGDNVRERILIFAIICILCIGEDITYSLLANLTLWYGYFGPRIRSVGQIAESDVVGANNCDIDDRFRENGEADFMKIAEINVTGVGSTGRIMLQIAQCARSHGHKVKTFSAVPFSIRNRKNMESQPEIIGHTYYGSYWSRGLHTILAVWFGGNGLGSILATAKLIRQLKEYSPDILHLHNLHTWCINLPMLFRYIKKERVRVVWTLHDCWTFTGHCPHFERIGCEKWRTGCYACPLYREYPNSKVDNSKVMYRLKKKWFTGVEDMTLVTPSKWLANLVKQSYLKEYPVKVINNGINLEVFRPTPSDFREKYHCEDKFILLGVADVWGEKKGLDVFIELSKRLSENYQIVLVGTNDAVDAQLPDNIISIHRTYNQEELAKIYTAADLFVNPTREEVLGLVNLEALACGTPVVTFNAGGSPECVDETCGSVVEIDDFDEMKNELIRIHQEEPYQQDDCIKKAGQFNMNDRFQEYVQLYEKLIRE